ncbi:response regulator [Flavobacterium sp. N1719]|uniref:response regulator n=1 Tax=Flavobacterium sp. N1719 TaxID=2885633 RepID=UPI002222A827|nr:response regulator [Flavobacterium sp. N1719]
MKKTNFIIIDDDDIFLKLGKMYLELGNCTSSVTLYNDASVALDIISGMLEHIDKKIVVFLDLNMPILNGFEFLDKIELLPNSKSEKLCIYIMTSSINYEDIEKAKKYEIVRKYLNKPITKEIVDGICANEI